MVVERDLLSFDAWLFGRSGNDGFVLGALPAFALALLGLGLVLLLGLFLRNVIYFGPGRAARMAFSGIVSGFADFANLSFQRTFALAWVAIKQSIQLGLLYVFGLFVLGLMFAAWFLDVESDHPARLYLSVVLTGAQFLSLLPMIFLGALSLPEDIESRTIYTVATKPVRPMEMVLGRILGFGAVGTLFLIIMGVSSYLFVTRGLDHAHAVGEQDYRVVTDVDGNSALEGRTSLTNSHRHEFVVDAKSGGRTDTRREHYHQVVVSEDADGNRSVEVGSPEGMLNARVPIYASNFTYVTKDRETQELVETQKGINVGNEWTYRQYIEGLTPWRAIWTFESVTPSNFPSGLPIEMTIAVFRTHKGTFAEEDGDAVTVAGTLQLRNPSNGNVSDERLFNASEYSIDSIFFSADNIRGSTAAGEPKQFDLFEDLVDSQGRIEIILRCQDPGQYFGVARHDIYLRAGDGLFIFNLTKGYLVIWMQMILVLSLAVVLSTVLNGPVAILATFASMILGYNYDFINRLIIRDYKQGGQPGGGFLESARRLFEQRNLVTEYENTVLWQIVQWIDYFLLLIMKGVSYLLPRFDEFNLSNYVAQGFDIPPDLLARQFLITIGYVVALTIVGYFFMKNREVAG